MQLFSSSSKLPEVFSFLSGVLLVLIPLLVRHWLDRKKRVIEDTEAAARTELTLANARSVEIRDNLAAGEGVGKLLSALIDAGDTIHELQSKNFRLEQDKMGQDMLWLDLQKASALLAYHSIPFHEAEHPAVKKLIEKLADCEPPYPTRTAPKSKKSKP